MKREFTATTYILDNDKVLLIYHKKLQKWLPPGGHIDPNETPPDAALQEVYGIPVHQHIDMIFVGRPLHGQLSEKPSETEGIRWFSWDEVKNRFLK